MYLSVNTEQEMKESYPTESCECFVDIGRAGPASDKCVFLRAVSTLGNLGVLTDDNRLAACLSPLSNSVILF